MDLAWGGARVTVSENEILTDTHNGRKDVLIRTFSFPSARLVFASASPSREPGAGRETE